MCLLDCCFCFLFFFFFLFFLFYTNSLPSRLQATTTKGRELIEKRDRQILDWKRTKNETIHRRIKELKVIGVRKARRRKGIPLDSGTRKETIRIETFLQNGIDTE